MTQHDDFQERLKRIRAQSESELALSADRDIPSASREIATNALYPLSLAGAFLLGILSVALGRCIRFHLVEGAGGGHGTDLDLLVTSGLSMATSVLLAQIFRLNSKEHLSMQSAGILVAICTFHNLFHWMPGPMSMAFSPGYVAEMQEATPPNTAIFRGFVLNLTDTDSRAEPQTWAEPGVEGGEPAAPVAKPGRLKMDSEK